MNVHEPVRFVCYYGPNRIKELESYDFAILQSAHYSHSEISELKSAGVQVAAYLSVGQTQHTSQTDGWALRDAETGDALIDSHWDTIIVDCRLRSWRSYIIEKMIPEILANGITGIFIDTVDTQERYPEIRNGMIDLLRAIRLEFPRVFLAVNRGFAILPVVLSISDAIVFEAFSSYYDGSLYRIWDSGDLEASSKIADRLNAEGRSVPVFTIDYAAIDNPTMREFAEQRALRYGFSPFVSTWSLDWLPEQSLS